MAFTYLNYNKYTYRPVERSYKQTVNNQLYTALVQWVKYADITANRAGIICLDKPGMFISVITGLFITRAISTFMADSRRIWIPTDLSKRLRASMQFLQEI